jgi:uncharacterized protein YaiI (UPF0178 family)
VTIQKLKCKIQNITSSDNFKLVQDQLLAVQTFEKARKVISDHGRQHASFNARKQSGKAREERHLQSTINEKERPQAWHCW